MPKSLWKIRSKVKAHVEGTALFARFYTPGKFVTFVRKTGRKVHFLPKLLMIFYCMQDEDTPKFIKLALMGPLGYVILPLIRARCLAGFGWLDDAAVVAAACAWPGPTSSRNTVKKYVTMFRSSASACEAGKAV